MKIEIAEELLAKLTNLALVGTDDEDGELVWIGKSKDWSKVERIISNK